MRFKSKKAGGYQVFAVTGTNTVSFGIDFDPQKIDGLLGFAIERIDPAENERFYLFGSKVFRSLIAQPDEKTKVTTFDHPMQSFVHDDFTAKPDREYTYNFYPVKGTPKNLVRAANPISITVKTEALFSDLEHDVFFNRGVASSQAYVREFRNKPPRDPSFDKVTQERALEWLSRKLDDAILKFIDSAKKGDTLLCCFYEFRYQPVAAALKKALGRKVKVRIIVDAKVNEHYDKHGDLVESFPREDNLRMIEKVKLPDASIILREAKPDNIQHNKFMVLLKGANATPKEVWTGSTNISDGGIHGQTNVGHWVRNPAIAEKFKAYWDLLSDDPGPGEDDAEARQKNTKLRTAVERIFDVPEAIEDIPRGITPVFSPRSGSAVLDLYAKMVDEADEVACITLAFGIGKVFKDLLKDNTNSGAISFLLLEKEDKPNPRSKDPFVAINASQNVYKAWGSFLGGPLYQWARETNARSLRLNTHVSYIHSKFLLKDPLGNDPIVVTGSANFSKASTNDNDENMLIIRGNRRVADIYFTEFNRLFYHYYFRSIQERTRKILSEADKSSSDQKTLFLSETDTWTKDYKKARSLKRKRVSIFTNIKGFQ